MLAGSQFGVQFSQTPTDADSDEDVRCRHQLGNQQDTMRRDATPDNTNTERIRVHIRILSLETRTIRFLHTGATQLPNDGKCN